jgi:hypothetical protein
VGARRDRLELPPAEWAPLNEAYDRVRTQAASGDVAAVDMQRDLRSGRLRAALRALVRDRETSRKLLPASFWKDVDLVPISADRQRGRPPTISVRSTVPHFPETWHFFIRRAELDRLYPPAAAGTTAADLAETPRNKPGPKPKGDWRNLTAAWVVAVAYEDPTKLRNISKLVDSASYFLDGKINWSPDTKQLRKHIMDLLRLCRGLG